MRAAPQNSAGCHTPSWFATRAAPPASRTTPTHDGARINRRAERSRTGTGSTGPAAGMIHQWRRMKLFFGGGGAAVSVTAAGAAAAGAGTVGGAATAGARAGLPTAGAGGALALRASSSCSTSATSCSTSLRRL